MKYTVSNTINKPLDEVIAHFRDPDCLPKWMEGLQRIEHISGTPGQVGAESKLHFLHKGKEMILKETILEENLPDQMKFAYQSPMGYNEVEIQFEKLSESSTRQFNTSYFELKGLMKITGPLMKGLFKKQSKKYLDAFKQYAENN